MTYLHRFTSPCGINLIKNFEGFRPAKYSCAAGYPTIGYEHRLTKDEKYTNVCQSEAEEILMNDLLKFEKIVLKYINVNLSDNQFDALVSFTFNLGPAALQRSTLRQKINNMDYEDAKEEFLKWTYAGGRRLSGLLKRRWAESLLFSNNIYRCDGFF
jgi:lysozyme